MIYLIIVSIIWSLSFTLIKGNLTSLDSSFVAFIRLFISLFVFLPFIKFRKYQNKYFWHFLLLGGIQYGLMYVSYIFSYQFLQAFEVAVLTIFTPIFVVIINDIWEKKFIKSHWIKAILAIFGTAIIIYSNNFSFGTWKGILLLQISNLCFAFGQIYYKKLVARDSQLSEKSNFVIIFLGAVIVSGIFSFLNTDFAQITISTNQIFTLLYLGIIASGLSFYLWNIGATKVSAGTLAIFNNLKIPLGILFAVILLQENISFIQFIFGGLIITSSFFIKDK